MAISTASFWLYFGLSLVVSEVILPGLVAIFVGLGALTVSLGLYLGHISDVTQQLLVFFVSSTVYIFSLRLLVMRFYPMDSDKKVIDDDEQSVGKIAVVVEQISGSETGRIQFDGTTWSAKSNSSETIKVGSEVEIMGRDNITWLVKSSE